MECDDERQAHVFDALGGELGFGRGEVGGERLVVEDGGDPAGEVVVGAVVAQYARVTADELVFQLGEVGGDRAGGGVGLGNGTGGRDLRLPGRTCARAAGAECHEART